jgi:hypothetical protein
LLASAAAHAVDLTAVSLRRAAGAAVTHSEWWLEDGIVFGREWAVIVKALSGGGGIDSLDDESGDVDDPLALVHACLDVIADSYLRGRSRCRAVDAHMPATAGPSGTRTRLGDPHGLQPLVDAH